MENSSTDGIGLLLKRTDIAKYHRHPCIDRQTTTANTKKVTTLQK